MLLLPDALSLLFCHQVWEILKFHPHWDNGRVQILVPHSDNGEIPRWWAKGVVISIASVKIRSCYSADAWVSAYCEHLVCQLDQNNSGYPPTWPLSASYGDFSASVRGICTPDLTQLVTPVHNHAQYLSQTLFQIIQRRTGIFQPHHAESRRRTSYCVQLELAKIPATWMDAHSRLLTWPAKLPTVDSQSHRSKLFCIKAISSAARYFL